MRSQRFEVHRHQSAFRNNIELPRSEGGAPASGGGFGRHIPSHLPNDTERGFDELADMLASLESVQERGFGRD